jgi:predicted ester cyclase
MSHSTSQSHKTLIEHFTEAINEHHIHKLDDFLDENVEKILDSKSVYKGIEGARDYYSMKHQTYPKGQWKIVEYLDEQHKNTIRARVLFDHKIYNILYTFGPSGKIQDIESFYDGEVGSSGGSSHPTSQSHKTLIEHFSEAVNELHVHKLDDFLDENVEKILDSKSVYKGIQGAREYYSMEHEAYPKGKWKILEYLDDQHKNTIRARVLFDHKIYNTLYTFGPSGKIQDIEANYEDEHGSSYGHK